MKKYVITILSIILISALFFTLNIIIYGTDTIYIADYQPITTNRQPFILLALCAAILYSSINIILNCFITIILVKIFKKLNIYKKEENTKILTICIFIIPIIVSIIQLILSFGYTC